MVVRCLGPERRQHPRSATSRIRDTFADGINMTNGSPNNLIANDEARATGDDSFALFAAQRRWRLQRDRQHDPERDRAAHLACRRRRRLRRRQQHDPELLRRRHALLPGSDRQLAELRLPVRRVRHGPPTTIQNFSLARDGGHFWGAQVFAASGCSRRPNRSRASGSTTRTSSIRPTPGSCSRRTTWAARAESVHGHHLHQHHHHRRAGRAATPTTPSRASASGPTRCRSRPGPGGRVGDLHRPDGEQQRHQHPEHHQHLHHHRQLGQHAPRKVRRIPKGSTLRDLTNCEKQ